ncbi:hypothetical protein [Mycoplasma capricolum]|uniref:hypothetical protein n=1 Tax=Mycoplasma capricolum TaxID=2095 RepID=UPI00059B16EC|nr:hypothetical protein [Mycoplasma capricolum]
MDSKIQINHKEWANKFKLKIQKTGSFMAGMIMPSIGILLAWGLWTAMFWTATLKKYNKIIH